MNTSPSTAATTATAAPRRSRSPLELAFRQFLRNRAALASLVILGIIIIACFVGPLLLSNDPAANDPAANDWGGK